MRRSPLKDQVCSVAQALAELGGWWTLLILREAFFGTQRFTDFRDRLGVAPNILSARLSSLVESGVLSCAAASGRGNPRLYRLTDKGRDALPVFITLMQWGDRWINNDGKAPVVVIEAATGKAIEPVRVRAGDGRPLAARDLKIVHGPAAPADIRRRFGSAVSSAATGGSTT
jgi:DNA-binding HxlR family transcriptional regulator